MMVSDRSSDHWSATGRGVARARRRERYFNMPEPTTRRGRFLYRQRRYLRRRYRQKKAGYKGTGSDGYGTLPARQFPKYSVGNDGMFPQLAADVQVLQDDNPVPLEYIDTWFPFTVTFDGPRKTRHVHWPLNYWRPPGTHHQDRAKIGVFRKRVAYAGHKVGRHGGFDWKCARARQWYLQYGGEGYPSWDPLHRTPVFDG
jgi:hypothetical protein